VAHYALELTDESIVEVVFILHITKMEEAKAVKELWQLDFLHLQHLRE